MNSLGLGKKGGSKSCIRMPSMPTVPPISEPPARTKAPFSSFKQLGLNLKSCVPRMATFKQLGVNLKSCVPRMPTPTTMSTSSFLPHTICTKAMPSPEDFPQHAHDLIIPPPPGENYSDLLEWLEYYFAPYFSKEFELFLVRDMQILCIPGLMHFLAYVDFRVLHESIGARTFIQFRKSIHDLQVIWSFIEKYYGPGLPPTVRYKDFQSHQALFPSYMRPRVGSATTDSTFQEYPNLRTPSSSPWWTLFTPTLHGSFSTPHTQH